MKTQITITISCPRCGSENIVRNGKKPNGKQLYRCQDCKRQFIADHEKVYKGTLSTISNQIRKMLVRGSGVRDIAIVLCVSVYKVLSTLAATEYDISPKKHYSKLEIDEFWTFVGKKANKQWLIYAYDRESREIVAYVMGDRSKKTAEKLREKLRGLGVTYGRIATDNWEAFIAAFDKNNTNAEHDIGKQYTNGIEGNNCLLRHRLRRVFRKTCCFSKMLLNHINAIEMTIFYLKFDKV